MAVVPSLNKTTYVVEPLRGAPKARAWHETAPQMGKKRLPGHSLTSDLSLRTAPQMEKKQPPSSRWEPKNIIDSIVLWLKAYPQFAQNTLARRDQLSTPLKDGLVAKPTRGRQQATQQASHLLIAVFRPPNPLLISRAD